MMNIYAKRGDKVIFTGQNGHDIEQRRAREQLTVGGVYEVEQTERYSFSSSVKLIGHKPFFNTVMFVSAPEGGNK